MPCICFRCTPAHARQLLVLCHCHCTTRKQRQGFFNIASFNARRQDHRHLAATSSPRCGDGGGGGTITVLARPALHRLPGLPNHARSLTSMASTPPVPESVASKTAHILTFLDPLLATHFHPSHPAAAASGAPFFLGLNGIQGAGKTTLVRDLAAKLRAAPYHLPTAVLSIDDLYLPHAAQRALAAQHPDNRLIQHRGQPGTHDVQLGARLFQDLRAGRPTRIPAYDKSAFDGEGDRLPESQWETVNEGPEQSALKVIIFEGWCVGFRPLDKTNLVEKWNASVQAKDQGSYHGRLAFNPVGSVDFINEKLRDYDQWTNALDALVHIDAVDTLWVYDWRLEQEEAMIKEKGSGMTTAQVKDFVDGYYPAYELFYDTLRQGVFHEPGRQLRVIIGKDRGTLEVIKL